VPTAPACFCPQIGSINPAATLMECNREKQSRVVQ
jgi:hypothetical protein